MCYSLAKESKTCKLRPVRMKAQRQNFIYLYLCWSESEIFLRFLNKRRINNMKFNYRMCYYPKWIKYYLECNSNILLSVFFTSRLCCEIKRSVYYPNLKNLTFLLILTFRGQACQPTATAEIRPQSICFSYKCQKKTNNMPQNSSASSQRIFSLLI